MTVLPAAGSIRRWSNLRKRRQNGPENCLIGKTLLLSHHGPPLPENLEELAQGPHNVVGIHHGPPGHVVGGDQPLRIKEGSSHLLGGGGMNLGLDWAWQSLPESLYWLMLGLRSVKWHRWLIHSYNIIHCCHWPPLGNRQQLCPSSCPLQFLLLTQNLGTHLPYFITRPISLLRMFWMVWTDTPWAKVSYFMLTKRSSPMLVATAAIWLDIFVVFFGFRCLWPSVLFPA